MSEQTAEAADVEELRRRMQALAPEALAGDPNALEELDVIEDEIAQELRRRGLSELAEQEHAERERVAAEAEAEKQRAELRADQAAAESECDKALATFEQALTKALAAAKTALEHNSIASAKKTALEPGTGYRRLSMEIENRILRRIRQELHAWHIKPGELWAREGMEPLAVAPARTKSTSKD